MFQNDKMNPGFTNEDTAFEKMPGAFIILDALGNFLFLNQNACEALGHQPGELPGKNINFFNKKISPELFAERFEAAKNKGSDSGIFKAYLASGKKKYFAFNSYYSVNRGGQEKLTLNIIDISEIYQTLKEHEFGSKVSDLNVMRLHKALLQLDKANKIAEESIRLKQEFIANMSHEIRTPLNSIIGFTSLLQNSLLNKEQRSFIDAIKISGENLLNIVNDILDFSKIESGGLVIEKTSFSISEIIKNLLSLFESRAKEKNLEFTVFIDPALPRLLEGDPVRVNQILLNLVSNAIKFTHKGHVRVNARFHHTENENIWVEFVVSDSGIGIPEDRQDDVFGSFVQASASTTRKYGGTGLGLAIVKKLSGLLGGSITLKSKPEAGSAFSVMLPFSAVSEEAAQKMNKQKKSATEQNPFSEMLQGLQVLVAEDNDFNKLLITKILNSWGCKPKIASDGKEVIGLLDKEHFDLILMDIQLPEMDGCETTEYIRKTMRNNIPIIAVTANANSEDFQKYIEIGMNGSVSKPFNPNDLFNSIITAVDLKPGKREQHLIPLTNLAALKQMAGPRDTFYSEILNIYVAQTPENCKKLKLSLAEKDYGTLRAIAHKMVSSAKFVGLEEAEVLLRKIEDDVAGQNTGNLAAYVERTIELSLIAVEEIKLHLNELNEGLH